MRVALDASIGRRSAEQLCDLPLARQFRITRARARSVPTPDRRTACRSGAHVGNGEEPSWSYGSTLPRIGDLDKCAGETGARSDMRQACIPPLAGLTRIATTRAIPSASKSGLAQKQADLTLKLGNHRTIIVNLRSFGSARQCNEAGEALLRQPVFHAQLPERKVRER